MTQLVQASAAGYSVAVNKADKRYFVLVIGVSFGKTRCKYLMQFHSKYRIDLPGCPPGRQVIRRVADMASAAEGRSDYRRHRQQNDKPVVEFQFAKPLSFVRSRPDGHNLHDDAAGRKPAGGFFFKMHKKIPFCANGET